MDWDQTNSRGNWLNRLIRPTRRTVENSWNCPLLKERSNKEETGFKESKRLRPIGQTNRPCSPWQRHRTKRRKRGWVAVSCESGYWKFEKWKLTKFSFTFCPRSEKWNENWIHSFREWKVKYKCLEFEIESEKWNENSLRSRLRVKSEMKMPRDQNREVIFLENSREILDNPEFSLFSSVSSNFMSEYKFALALFSWVYPL